MWHENTQTSIATLLLLQTVSRDALKFYECLLSSTFPYALFYLCKVKLNQPFFGGFLQYMKRL